MAADGGAPSSSGANTRMTPYSPSKPASRITAPRRTRSTASATSGGAAFAIASTGTRSRISSSGPSRSTMPATVAATALLLGPTPRTSPTSSGSWSRLRKPAAPAGR